MSYFIRLLLVFTLFSFLPLTSWACDFCALYHSLEQRVPQGNSFHFGISEQFTEYGKLQSGGERVSNTAHERLLSSQTLFSAAYDFSDKVSLEALLPYINRRFTRSVGHGTERGTEAGIGDLSLLLLYVPYKHIGADSNVAIQLFGGVKLPSGNSDRLNEESTEEEDHHDTETHSLRHGDETTSAIHGHDLALGTGSVDVPLGAAFFAQQGRFLIEGNSEYMLRSEGDHGYRYANDLRWRIGPGYYALLDDDFALSAKINLSGEYKGKDRVNGEKENDTSLNAVYWGPEINATMRNCLGAFFAYERPLEIENSGLQAVMSYRLRAGIRYRF